MNNTFFKKAVLTLTLGLLSNTSIATKRTYDDEISDLKRSKTDIQVSSQYIEDHIERSQKLVFSGEPLLNIGSYLGRQETGRMLQVSKGINGFFKQQKEALQLWKSYVQQLQLEIADDISFSKLISQIRNYYKPQIDVLFDNSNLHFSNSSIPCSNFKGFVLAGWAYEGLYSNRLKAVIWKDGILQTLRQLNNKKWNEATAISEDGAIVAGKIYYGQGDDKSEAVIWNGRRKLYLNAYPFKKYHDPLSSIITISRNGSDFIARSETSKTYKAHIPRYDLWKMK